jgi:hypothetical protein
MAAPFHCPECAGEGKPFILTDPCERHPYKSTGLRITTYQMPKNAKKIGDAREGTSQGFEFKPGIPPALVFDYLAEVCRMVRDMDRIEMVRFFREKGIDPFSPIQ